MPQILKFTQDLVSPRRLVLVSVLLMFGLGANPPLTLSEGKATELVLKTIDEPFVSRGWGPMIGQEQAPIEKQVEWVQVPPIKAAGTRMPSARPILVRLVPIRESNVLVDIYLDKERSMIQGQVKDIIEEIAELLEPIEWLQMNIETHCDERETRAYSMVLGNTRAWHVTQYIQGLGLSKAKTHPISFGKEKPPCQERSASCWEENIRMQSTFRFIAIAASKSGCLARLRIFAEPAGRPALVRSPKAPYLQKIHLAPFSDPLRIPQNTSG